MHTFAEMGLYDDVASIKAIKEVTGEDKIFYLGYSQGTIQMFYGLSHLEDEFYADNLHKVVQLAPCFGDNYTYEGDKQDINDKIHFLEDNGVWAVCGPNWEDDLQTICDNNSKSVCHHYKGYTGNQGISVPMLNHWSQNIAVNRFQEYVTDAKWLAGEYIAEEVHLENIKRVPISMFVATNDNSCTPEASYHYIPMIQSPTNIIPVEGKDHGYFSEEATSQWFMDNLIAQL